MPLHPLLPQSEDICYEPWQKCWKWVIEDVDKHANFNRNKYRVPDDLADKQMIEKHESKKDGRQKHRLRCVWIRIVRSKAVACEHAYTQKIKQHAHNCKINLPATGIIQEPQIAADRFCFHNYQSTSRAPTMPSTPKFSKKSMTKPISFTATVSTLFILFINKPFNELARNSFCW